MWLKTTKFEGVVVLQSWTFLYNIENAMYRKLISFNS